MFLPESGHSQRPWPGARWIARLTLGSQRRSDEDDPARQTAVFAHLPPESCSFANGKVAVEQLSSAAPFDHWG